MERRGQRRVGLHIAVNLPFSDPSHGKMRIPSTATRYSGHCDSRRGGGAMVSDSAPSFGSGSHAVMLDVDGKGSTLHQWSR
jgi:hypothetical protein